MDNEQVKQKISNLSPEQRARLEERLRAGARTGRGIPKRPDESVFPMSPAQERLWGLSRRRGGDPVYNIFGIWEVSGPLEIEALEASFRMVVDRHETLRSRYTEDGGRPVATIRPTSEFSLEHLDLSGVDHEGCIEELGRQADRPFDLNDDFLFRAILARSQEDEHFIVVVAHHIVCDGWSMGNLVSELGSAYADLSKGREPQLAPLQVSYADFAWSVRESGAHMRDLEFWEEQLAEGVEALRLPRSTHQVGTSYTAASSYAFEVGEDLTERAREVTRQKRTTLFALLLGAYQATLNRITGQTSLTLCTPVAGRIHRDVEDLIGYFNNIVPLTLDLRGDPDLGQVSVLAAESISAAFDHSQAPFQDIARLPGVATEPLTRGLFVLQDSGPPTPELPGLTVAHVDHEPASSDFDLAVFLRPIEGRLRGLVVYRSALFRREDIESVFDDFVDVVHAFVNHPEWRLSDLPELQVGWSAELGEDRKNPTEDRPISPVEARLLRIWSNAFGHHVDRNDDFFDLGGHSLLAAELMAEVEREFGLQPLPLSTLFEAPTPAELARVLGRENEADGWEYLVPIKPTGDRPPLYFVHAHGGNVIGYNDLARNLSDRQPLYGIQAPRMTSNEVLRIEEMAKLYIEEIRSLQPKGPYLVGGWCLGADVAFEMAQQLRQSGEDVPLVLMVDNPRPEVLPGTRFDRAMTRFEMEISNFLEQPRGEVLNYTIERVGRLLKRLLVRIERGLTNEHGQLPFRIGHSRPYRQWYAAAVHDKAYEAYSPSRYDGDIALFRAEKQPKARRDRLGLGWEPYVGGRLIEYELPGHRIGMLSEPRVKQGAKVIEGAIAESLETRDQHD